MYYQDRDVGILPAYITNPAATNSGLGISIFIFQNLDLLEINLCLIPDGWHMTTFAYVQVPSKLASPNTYISIKSKKSIHSLIFIFTSNFFSHLFLFFTIYSGSAHSINAWGHGYYVREFPCRQNYIKRMKYLLLKYCSFRQLCNFLWDIYSCAIIIFAPGKIHHFLFIQFHHQLLLCLSLIIICDGFLSLQS